MDRLHPDPSNPNVMSAEKQQALAESIKRNQFLQHIIADQDFMIVDGHHRYEAAKSLGFTEIPVVQVRIDAPEERIMVRQAMNKLHGVHDPIKDLADLQALKAWDPTALSAVLAISDEQFKKMQSVFGEGGAGGGGERKEDAEKLSHHEDTFLHGNIKQIYLFFNNEEYSELIPRLQAIMQSFGVEDHTSLFLRLVDFYENNTGGEAPKS